MDLKILDFRSGGLDLTIPTGIWRDTRSTNNDTTKVLWLSGIAGNCRPGRMGEWEGTSYRKDLLALCIGVLLTMEGRGSLGEAVASRDC